MEIQTPRSIEFNVYMRVHSYSPKGEWVMSISLDSTAPWVVFTWAKKPSDKAIQEIEVLVMRSMELYHRHVSVPYFDLKEVDKTIQ